MTVIHITDYDNMEYVLIKHKMFTYAVAGPGFYHRYMHLRTFAMSNREDQTVSIHNNSCNLEPPSANGFGYLAFVQTLAEEN